jgi:beta-fructofuranosidase
MLLVVSPHSATADELLPFQPPGMWIWDNWFVHDGTRWHAFYLELPKAIGPERRHKGNDFYKHVGHATSTDLWHWQNEGPALGALSGTWNDRHIATGSILHHAGKWWMFFTGRGQKEDGVGLALSDDLMTWKTEPRPLFPLSDTFAKTGHAPFQSPWRGEPHSWIGISDPYIYPEPIDGWFYLVLCSRVLGVPLEESGCLAMVRSQDLQHWEAAGIIAWPRCFERMETPQLWQHEGRWHVSFGGVLNEPWVKDHPEKLLAAVRGQRTHRNYCYALPGFQGPARDEDLHLIALTGSNYIMKVLPRSGDTDVAFFTVTDKERGSSLSLPYSVRYLPDGGVQVDPMTPPSHP